MLTIDKHKGFKRREGLHSKKEAVKIAENWRRKGYYARVLTRVSKGVKYHIVFTKKR